MNEKTQNDNKQEKGLQRTQHEYPVSTEQLREQMQYLEAEEIDAKLKELSARGEIVSEYLSLEPGEQIRAVFTGVDEFNGAEDEEPREAVTLRNGEGSFITASAVLVSALRKLPIMTPIEITAKEEVKTGGGRAYKNYSVQLLVPDTQKTSKKTKKSK